MNVIFFHFNFSCNLLNKDLFEEFVWKIKNDLEPYNVSLSASFNGSVDTLTDAFTYSNLSKHLDFMQFTIDTIEAEKNESNGILDLNKLIDGLEKSGLSSEKIVIGLQKFGGKEVDIIRAIRYYYVLKKNRAHSEWFFPTFVKQNDSTLKTIPKWSQEWPVPITVKLIESNTLRVESARSIANQVRFVMRRNVAGIMAFAVNSYNYFNHSEFVADTFVDFKPATGVTLNLPKQNSDNYPLLPTIATAMNIALDELDQEAQLRQKMV